jgi:hypothetical protein
MAAFADKALYSTVVHFKVDAPNPSQVVPLPAGFGSPKAILFWSVGAVSTDTVEKKTWRFSFGAATSTSERWAVGSVNQHAAADMVAKSRGITNGSITFLTDNFGPGNAGDIYFKGDVTNFGTDQFTVTWIDGVSSPAHQYWVSALVYGGTELRAHAGTFSWATSPAIDTGDWEEMPADFDAEPEALIMASVDGLLNDTTIDGARPTVGACSLAALDQWTRGNDWPDGVATQEVASTTEGGTPASPPVNPLIIWPATHTGPSGAPSIEITGKDEGGGSGQGRFQWFLRDTIGSNRGFGYLCLSTGGKVAWQAGAHQFLLSSATQQNMTEVGFLSEGAFFWTQLTNWSTLGSEVDTNVGCPFGGATALSKDDTANLGHHFITTQKDTASAQNRCIFENTDWLTILLRTGTVDGQVDFDGFTATGFDYTPTNTIASAKILFWLAWADSEVVDGTPQAAAASTSGTVDKFEKVSGTPQASPAVVRGSVVFKYWVSGTPQASAASTAGDVRTADLVTGTPQADPAITAGSVQSRHDVSGTPQADAATTVGDVVFGLARRLSGDVVAGEADTAGNLEHRHAVSGTVAAEVNTVAGTVAPTHHVSGAVSVGSPNTTGFLDFVEGLAGAVSAGEAETSGSLERIITASDGSPQAEACTTTGTADIANDLSGTPAAEAATASGEVDRGIWGISGDVAASRASTTGTVNELYRVSGTPQVGAAATDGDLVVGGEEASGAVQAGAATTAGQLLRGTVVSGAAQASAATVNGRFGKFRSSWEDELVTVASVVYDPDLRQLRTTVTMDPDLSEETVRGLYDLDLRRLRLTVEKNR